MKLQKLMLMLFVCNSQLIVASEANFFDGETILSDQTFDEFTSSGPLQATKVTANRVQAGGTSDFTGCTFGYINTTGLVSFENCQIVAGKTHGSVIIDESTVEGDFESEESFKAHDSTFKGVVTVSSGAKFNKSLIKKIIVQRAVLKAAQKTTTSGRKMGNISIVGLGENCTVGGNVVIKQSLISTSSPWAYDSFAEKHSKMNMVAVGAHSKVGGNVTIIQSPVSSSSSAPLFDPNYKITLFGGNAEEVVFESDNGTLVLRGGATVGNIVGGKIIRE